MKKILLFTILILSALYIEKSCAIPNPWVDCGDDISCGANKAGFNLPVRVQNYSVRAMEDMIEITFPLDRKRTVTLRKSQTYNGTADENGIIDISGVYNNYPVNKNLKLKNGVIFKVRGNKNKFYVANFAAETGYYSFYCEKGMKK